MQLKRRPCSTASTIECGPAPFTGPGAIALRSIAFDLTQLLAIRVHALPRPADVSLVTFIKAVESSDVRTVLIESAATWYALPSAERQRRQFTD
jgi:Ni,Fe-hydrogenase III small subunit